MMKATESNLAGDGEGDHESDSLDANTLLALGLIMTSKKCVWLSRYISDYHVKDALFRVGIAFISLSEVLAYLICSCQQMLA
jgi:hypothetical protein